MKTGMIGFSCFAAFLLSCSNQQISSNEVPSVVQNVVKGKYPDANKIEWKNLSNAYEAEFDINDSVDVSMQVSRDGKPLMLKEEIHPNALPSVVKEALGKAYADYSIEDAEKLEKDGVVYYQLELEGQGKKDLQLVFVADGSENKTISYWD